MLAALAWIALHLAQKPSQDPCLAFRQKIHDVYDFRPSHLTPAQQGDKSRQMNEVWKMVKDEPDTLVPCLRTAVQDPKSDAWFRVDGSGLLCEVDTSPDAKKIRLAIWTQANWQDLDPREWMRVMTRLGVDGLDTSAAGKRWLDDPSGKFTIAEHALEVGPQEGAWFLFGSMDESFATPILTKLLADKRQKVRDRAFEALVMQATPEAFTALMKTDLSTISAHTRKWEWELLKHIDDPLSKPADSTLTRETLVAAFKAFLADDPKPLRATQVDEGGKKRPWGDLVIAQLEKNDWPLFRQVRRKRMTDLSDEALTDYVWYTTLLLPRLSTPEIVAWTKELTK